MAHTSEAPQLCASAYEVYAEAPGGLKGRITKASGDGDVVLRLKKRLHGNNKDGSRQWASLEDTDSDGKPTGGTRGSKQLRKTLNVKHNKKTKQAVLRQRGKN